MNKKKVLNAFFWKFAERGSVQTVSFITSIVLARLLSPADYGQVALLMVIINILYVFVDSGLANALIQKKNADSDDFSTVFFFNIFFSVLLYGGLFALAPIIAVFYHDDGLTDLIRVLGFILIISGIQNVQQAYITKKLEFRIFFYVSLLSLIVSAVVGIIMAYSGYGVWSLVTQNVLAGVIGIIVMWFMSEWRPQLVFSLESFKQLFAFGARLLTASMLDAIYNNLRQLIIGKMYTTSDLAFYNQGEKFPMLIVTNVNTSLSSVLFPAMSDAQNNPEKVKNMVRRTIQVAGFIMWPLMVMLAVIAEPLVRVVLTAKWLPLVPYLQACCLTYVLWPIHTSNLSGIKALGRSDIFLRLEIIKKVIGLGILLPTVFISPLAMCYGAIVISFVSSIVNASPNKKLLNYSYLTQIGDIMPSMIMALVMGGIIYLVLFLNMNDIMTVILQVMLGIICYLGIAKMTNNKVLDYLLTNIKNRG